MIVSFFTFAQQETQSSQFMINPQMLNPAYSSVDNNLNLKVGYRNQWVGLEGAPVTSFASLNGPIHKSRWARTHPGDFHNWHGAGLTVLSDQLGPYSTIKLNANYSYNMKIKEGRKYGYYHQDGLRFVLGASVGTSSYKIDKDILSQTKNLNLETTDHAPTISDPRYQDLDIARQRALDVNLGGIIYYDNTYYLGVSSTQLLQNFQSNIDEISLARHYFISATYKRRINQAWYVIPSTIVKLVRGAPVSLNFTTRIDWQDKAYFGIGYRSSDAMTLMAGYHFKWGEKVKHFKVDKHRYMMDVFYSYDWTTSRLGKRQISQNSKGSHEITIAFFLPPMFHERNAEDTW